MAESNFTAVRQCKKCGTADRYSSGNCKACARASSSAWAQQNPEKVKASSAAWYAANPEKAKARVDAWKAANPEKRGASWHSKYPEKSREKSAAWRAANPEKHRESAKKWALENPEKHKAGCAAFHAANPEYSRIREQNRRSRKMEVGGVLSKGLAKTLFKMQKGKCPCCSEPLGDDYHLDHKMPLALGGTNTDNNMQLLRKKCNLQKKAKHPVDFMQSRGFLL